MAYSEYLVETYRNAGEPSGKGVRVRPLAGQGLPVDMNVECSSRMRSQHPVGTVFVLRAKVTDRQGGPPFLYSSFQWPYRVATPEEIQRLASQRRSG